MVTIDSNYLLTNSTNIQESCLCEIERVGFLQSTVGFLQLAVLGETVLSIEVALTCAKQYFSAILNANECVFACHHIFIYLLFIFYYFDTGTVRSW